jgi:hypothetical protein
LPVLALATIAVIIGLLVAPRPHHHEDKGVATPPPLADVPTTLSAASGQRSVLVRDGVTLSLHGPGSVTVTREANGQLAVRVEGGLLVAERTAVAPAIAYTAGANHVVSRDRIFAVHVEPAMIVLGAGDEATQIVDRYALDVAASPIPPAGTPEATPEPPPPTPPTDAPVRKMVTSDAPPHATRAPDPRTPTDPREPPKLVEIPVDAAELYKRAEAALAVRDPDTARDQLQRLLREFPSDTRADAARYDLALLARAAGDRAIALDLLDTIIKTGTDANLRAAARKLRDSIASTMPH